MDVISQRDAHLTGKLRYFTGKPCRNGHISERYVRSGACIACLNRYAKFVPNPVTRELVALAPEMIYMPDGLSVDQVKAFNDYLRTCAMYWVRSQGLMTEARERGYAVDEAHRQQLAKT